MRTLRVAVLTACAAIGCRTGPYAPGSSFTGAALLAPSSPDEEAHDVLLRADIARSDSVMRLGYVRGQETVFASDVIYLRGGLPLVRGRAAALSIAAAESLGASTTVRWQPVRAEASADGRSGYSYGFSVYSAAGEAAPVVRVDRYIAFWRREHDEWRIVAYAETYGAPPPAIATPSVAKAATMRDALMEESRGALESMRSTDVEFSRDAQERGTGAAFGRFAAADAQVFSGSGELITGPDAIMQSFGAPSAGNNLVWHPVAGAVSAAGDLGFTVGTAVHTGGRDNGTRTVGYSKYLTVWKKQRDGRWRYVVDGGSARPED